MKITRDTHPRICFFLQLIEEDNGGHLIGTVYPGTAIDFSEFSFPEDFDELILQAAGGGREFAVSLETAVEAAERGLQTLGDLDVGTLAMGEQTEAETISKRSTDLKFAYALGNVYFDNMR